MFIQIFEAYKPPQPARERESEREKKERGFGSPTRGRIHYIYVYIPYTLGNTFIYTYIPPSWSYISLVYPFPNIPITHRHHNR